MFLRGKVVFAAFVLAVVRSATAQVLYGSIVGEIKDASEAVVPGAVVVVTQVQTQLTRRTVTDTGGRYTFATLTPGDYDVKITASGFKTFAKTNVPVTLNSVTRVDALLE